MCDPKRRQPSNPCLLEDFIGAPLLLRQHKPLALTEAGATLYSVVGDCFFRLQAVTHHLRKSKNRLLKIVAQTSIAVEWLAPRLPLFQQQYPDIQTLLHMESSASSLDANAFDVVIGTWPTPAGFVSQRIRTEWWFPVCAPAQYELLDLTNPASIFAYPLYSSEQGEDWQLWRQQMQLREPAKMEMAQVSLALLATKAVSCGKGLALSNSFIAGDAIRQGQLKAHYQLALPAALGPISAALPPGRQFSVNKSHIFNQLAVATSMQSRCLTICNSYPDANAFLHPTLAGNAADSQPKLSLLRTEQPQQGKGRVLQPQATTTFSAALNRRSQHQRLGT